MIPRSRLRQFDTTSTCGSPRGEHEMQHCHGDLHRPHLHRRKNDLLASLRCVSFIPVPSDGPSSVSRIRRGACVATHEWQFPRPVCSLLRRRRLWLPRRVRIKVHAVKSGWHVRMPGLPRVPPAKALDCKSTASCRSCRRRLSRGPRGYPCRKSVRNRLRTARQGIHILGNRLLSAQSHRRCRCRGALRRRDLQIQTAIRHSSKHLQAKTTQFARLRR